MRAEVGGAGLCLVSTVRAVCGQGGRVCVCVWCDVVCVCEREEGGGGGSTSCAPYQRSSRGATSQRPSITAVELTPRQ
jgi:hypothetical protein